MPLFLKEPKDSLEIDRVSVWHLMLLAIHTDERQAEVAPINYIFVGYRHITSINVANVLIPKDIS